MSILEVLVVEAFVSIFMSLAVLYPIAYIKHPEECKKYFIKYFLLRAIILIIGNFVNTNIWMLDSFMVFIGVGVILPITAIKYRENAAKVLLKKMPEFDIKDIDLEDIQSLPTDITELSEIFQDYEIEKESDNQNSIFDESFENFDTLLEKYIIQSIDNKNDINKENIKQVKMARILLSLITFLNISYMCLYHRNFIACFIIQIITVLIYYYSLKKMNILNFIKKQIRARPDDNMDYIIASAKQSIGTKANLKSKYIFPITLIICCVLFFRPHIIYEREGDDYAVRYYTLAIFNESHVEIPNEHNGKKVVEIRGNTFSNLKNLETISLPTYITEIRGNTFENSGIKAILIPEGVTRIGGHAFYGCENLITVILPSTLEEIGSSAFRKCNSLYTIGVPQNTKINPKAFKESPTRVERY